MTLSMRDAKKLTASGYILLRRRDPPGQPPQIWKNTGEGWKKHSSYPTKAHRDRVMSALLQKNTMLEDR